MGNAASTTRHPSMQLPAISMPNTLQVQHSSSSGGGGGGSVSSVTPTATPVSAGGPKSGAAHPHKKHHYQRPPCACQHLHPSKTCLSYVVSSFGRAFYLSYGIKAGISLLLHLIKLLRSKRPSAVFELDQLVGAHGLPLDAVRMGLFLGSFTGLYNGVRCLLARWTGRDDAVTVMTAGAVAGLSINFHPADSHRTLALYIFARVFQCAYNRAKMEGRFHLWGSDWAHGDSLLFAFGTAQVMYSYVMRPDTLPPAYFKFIVETGPIPLRVLEQVKASNRGLAVDVGALSQVYTKLAPAGARPIADILQDLATRAYGPGAPAALPPILPCAILHPQNAHCHHQWVETFLNAAKRSLPLYTSLTFVPLFVLRFWHFVRHPVDSVLRSVWSIGRSTSFLSSFVSLYMFLICMQRRAFLRDHRSAYWLAGFAASWTILLEQKSRRSELALYVLPRAIDSLLQTLQDRKLLAAVPHGEKALFCAGMSLLMFYREFHAETMSPLLRRLLNFFVPTFKSLPKELPHTLQEAHTVATAAVTANAAAAAPSVGAPADSPASGDGCVLSRGDSDGLSTASIDGVIPLPSPGVSLSREQSLSQVAFLPSLPPFISNSRAPPRDHSPATASASPSPNGFSPDPCCAPGDSPVPDLVQVLVQPVVQLPTAVSAPTKNGVCALPCVVEPPGADDAEEAADAATGAAAAAPSDRDPSPAAQGYVEKEVAVIEERVETAATTQTSQNETKQQQKKQKGRKK